MTCIVEKLVQKKKKKKKTGDITACPTRRTYNFRPDVGSSSTCAPRTRSFAKRGTAVFSARQFVCVKPRINLTNERMNEPEHTIEGSNRCELKEDSSFSPLFQLAEQRNRDNFSSFTPPSPGKTHRTLHVCVR